MDQGKLSRREVLAGLAVTGSSGAIVGSGTGALFSDREAFTNNSIRASESTAGVVELSVETESLPEGKTGQRFTVKLPGDRNNPSYVWVRSTCPGDGDNIRVQLRATYNGCEESLTGSLREVLDYLRSGRLLACPGEDPCLQSGEEVTLELEVLEGYNGSFDTQETYLEFLGRQCRYEEPVNPFDPDEERCPPPEQGKGISFIAFCSRDGTTLNPSITEVLGEKTDDDETELTSVVWETEADVDYIVVKAGTYFTIYDYEEYVVTSGVATTGDNTDADAYVGDVDQSRSSSPCQLAAETVEDSDFPSDGISVKLEYCEGEDDRALQFRPEEECAKNNEGEQ